MLRPGQVQAGINLTLSAEPAYAIRGVLRELGQPKSGYQVAAFLGRLDPGRTGPAVQVASATTDARGRFLLAGISSGTFRLVGFQPRPRVVRELPSELAWAETEVHISTGDVQDLTLDLVNLPAFEGVISVVGESRAPLPLRSVIVTLEPDMGGTPVGPGLIRALPDEDGRLALSHLVPGDYALQLAVPRGWAVQRVSVNGTPLVGRLLHRPAGAAAIFEIDLTSQLGSAVVVVRQSPRNAVESSAVVVLFPESRSLWTTAAQDVDRFRLARVDGSGRAEFGDLLPGDYLVAGIAANHPGVEWRDRQALQRLALEASALRVSAGRQTNASVALSPP
jgi:hypothetical protein